MGEAVSRAVRRNKKAGPKSGLRNRVGESLFSAVTATTAAITTTSTVATPTTATPAAAITAAAATTTPVAAAEATATTGRTLFTRTGDIDREGPAFYLVAVEFFHRFLGLVAVPHRDERETTGPSRELVEDDLNDIDRADLTEQGLEVLGGAGEG